MTSTPDLEWDGLERVWRGIGADGEERWIRRQVDRHTRMLRLVVAIEILVTVVALGSIGWTLVAARTPLTVGLASVGTVHTAIIWGFTVWNRAGTWRPLGDSTREYLEVARERCRRERRTARFMIGMVVVEAVAVAAWLLGDRPTLDRLAGWSWWWYPPIVVMAGVVIWAVVQDRRARHRLARLDRAAQAFALEPSSV